MLYYKRELKGLNVRRSTHTMSLTLLDVIISRNMQIMVMKIIDRMNILQTMNEQAPIFQYI